MEALILLVGAGIPALFLYLFSHPTRDETDAEYMDRIFTRSPKGKDRLRKRVPEYEYSKRRRTATKRRR